MLKRFFDAFTRLYLTADLRSLALGRIVLASVLLLDLIKRWLELSNFYTNDGLVPNHTLLWRPAFAHSISFFYMASYWYDAIFGFFLCLCAYSLLLIGFRTRLAQVASWFCVINLHGRLLIFDNGGDVVLGLLATWTMFVPTGKRFSVDALLERRRAAQAQGEGEPKASGPEPGHFVGLGALAIVFQFAAIYFFNAANKSGPTWRDGSAVHYALNLDRLATWFGVWLRNAMTPKVCHLLTWGALATEALLPALILSPFFRRWCRLLAIALVIGLHTGFGICMNLGVFVPAMIAYTPNLLVSEHWDWLARWWQKSERRSAWLTRWNERCAALVGHLADRMTPGRYVRVSEPGPWARAFYARLPLARELACTGFLFIAGNQLLDENPAAHRVWDHHNAPPVAALVTYLNLFQGWVMFAPDAPMGDLNLTVEATTVDGRKVDPYNQVANPRYPQPGRVVPDAMGTGWLFYGYANRLPGYPAYNQALQEWILRYPERTGNPNDRIRHFEAYAVEDDTQPLGERVPRNRRSRLLLHYP